MAKSVLVILLLATGSAVPAAGQTGAPDSAGGVSEGRSSGPLHTQFLAPTGATVPRPGALPRNLGTTRLDRQSFDRDDRIERSICSNC